MDVAMGGIGEAQAAAPAANLNNLMGMAGTAERAGNHEEAIAYYNRVLEADPSFSQAWLGKGRAAGWLSSLANVRIGETLIAFGHAMATAGDDAPIVRAQAATDLTAICAGIYGMARRHFTEHAEVPAARTTYVNVSATLSDAVEQAIAWHPGDRATLDLMVLIARQLLDYGVSAEIAGVLRTRMDAANAGIEALDPSYQRPGLAEVTQTQREQNKAEIDNIGYIVLFIVVVLGAIVAAASRH